MAKGDRRIYNLHYMLPAQVGTCGEFFQFVKACGDYGARKTIPPPPEERNGGGNCGIKIRVECPTTGKSRAQNMSEVIADRYPDVQVLEHSREYK
jgi:hypothetical protein